MDARESSSKTPWIVLGAILGAAFIGMVALGLAAAYLYFHGGPLVGQKTAAPSPYAETAGVPSDSRQLAEEAADHFNSGNYGNAAADYQQIIDRHPDCLYAWSNLGVTRFTAGDLNGAREALEKSVELSPNDGFSWSNLGITFYQLRNYDGAVAAL